MQNLIDHTEIRVAVRNT